ncbi:hypothetical protein HF086_016668 [Spodoptera exigua]|uniref:Uncharacterized protein n=1 Tax=Spodoptera exigua TaxID=7107 RepID=A0A922M2T5_SPOEX|nr:hypothetical protein HF086_016668 [Spodoptera exigua]
MSVDIVGDDATNSEGRLRALSPTTTPQRLFSGLTQRSFSGPAREDASASVLSHAPCVAGSDIVSDFSYNESIREFARPFKRSPDQHEKPAERAVIQADQE